jgi:hypothetical protein
MKYYTVYVGAIEVVDYYLKDRKKAERIKEMWEKDGYDDVVIVEINEEEIKKEKMILF